MKYHVWNIGCQMNEADARDLAARLEGLGWEPGARADEADLLVVNSCVVRQPVEDRVFARLRQAREFKRRRPGLRVALMGCLVGQRATAPGDPRLADADILVPPSDPTPLLNWLQATGPAPVSAGRGAVWPPSRRGEVVATVPVVLGCSRACTYCVIPYRRGRERSRPADDVQREVEALAAAGLREIILLGQIVDRYGTDQPGGPTLAGLLRAVAKVAGVRRIRFLSSHPAFLDDDLIRTVADTPGVCPHFELPVQSGSDAVLARMRRGYTADDYRRLVERLRNRLPEAAINTDLIVGFPGESAKDHAATGRLLAELQLDKIRVAPYSPRPQTLAARQYADDVPPAEKERRRRELEDLQTGILAAKHASLIGRETAVLIERCDRRPGRWMGRTVRDQVVFVDDPRDLRGQEVRATVSWAGPFSLVGSCADAPANPPATTKAPG